MEIYKFGGASVKDAEAVKNLVEVLKTTGTSRKMLVISAMAKTTNALEYIIDLYFKKDKDLALAISDLKTFHLDICQELFSSTSHPVYQKIDSFFENLAVFLEHNKSPNYDYVYDQIVCLGELVSSTIVSEYLNEIGCTNTWHDCRNLIKTNEDFRDAEVNWEETQQNITSYINTDLLNISQGFIASDHDNFTTTLGREGSDYSAAIFAYCLNAESLTIWKDVPGVLNGDPRVFENTTLLDQISYEEAIELAFYGASVIHPKTLQPLQRKEIPLFVKAFSNPEGKGTCVMKGEKLIPKTPCFIVKNDLILLSLASLDFSFFVEKNIAEIFALFDKYQIKVDLIQNSAISFSVCVNNKFNTIDELISILKAKFKVTYNKNVSLYTIRHFDDAALKSIEKDKDILLKQYTRETVQLVVK
ncbi:MAG: aspartate kinase [Psychroflexus halocasei]|uniref:aspartate kinase n=1 Tax=Psychroflexus sp. S27 TaxID=1982757 RepID=UPI000C29BA62|nr:aspartate kinase [Psychroflexus sp. S27]PJX27580.1 aspartate kinase [Psychroflexus sp. S27]